MWVSPGVRKPPPQATGSAAGTLVARSPAQRPQGPSLQAASEDDGLAAAPRKRTAVNRGVREPGAPGWWQVVPHVARLRRFGEERHKAESVFLPAPVAVDQT